MRNCFVASLFVVLSCCTTVPAQSVGSTSPVVVQTEYISSSSPTSDGRVVTSYYSTQAPTPATRAYYPQNGGTRIVYQPTSATASNASAAPALDPYYGTQTVQTASTPSYANACCQPCSGHAPTVTYYPSTPQGFAPPSGYNAYSSSAPNQSMPPGAYYGTGLIGQPKLYMDGQPVRNVFRFIFP